MLHRQLLFIDTKVIHFFYCSILDLLVIVLIFDLSLRFWCGQQNTFADSAILIAIWFIGGDAEVGKTFISDADLLLAEVVAQCFNATKIVMFCADFKVDYGAFLFV